MKIVHNKFTPNTQCNAFTGESKKDITIEKIKKGFGTHYLYNIDA
jgi:hypothetical protein